MFLFSLHLLLLIFNSLYCLSAREQQLAHIYTMFCTYSHVVKRVFLQIYFIHADETRLLQ